LDNKVPTIIGKDGKPVKFISKIIINNSGEVTNDNATTSTPVGEVAPEDFKNLESTLVYNNGEEKKHE